jgi:hypothetical protein
MSKTASSDVHELIHSLTKSEKRYFKLYCSRHSSSTDNNYVQLFDFITGQKEYNESEIFTYFQGELFLNKFSITKNRLYDQIIKSLDAFHTTRSAEAQLYKQMHASSILYQKGLYQQALKTLRSARKLAAKLEHVTILLEINQKLKQLNESFGKKCFDKEAIDTIHQRDYVYTQQLGYYTLLWKIKGELFAEMNAKGKARCEASRESYHKLIQSLLQQDFKGDKTFEISYLENHIWSAYYYATLNEEKSLTFVKNNVDLYEANPKRIQQEPNKYFALVSNLVHLKCTRNNYLAANEYLKRLKSFPKDFGIAATVDIEIKRFSMIYSTETMLYLKQSEFDKAAELAEEISAGLHRFDDKIAPIRRAYLYFQMAVAFFGVGEYSKSLKWLNDLFNDTGIDEKEDIVSFAHMLNLVVHLEMQNYRLLPYSIQRAKRFLKKKNRTFKFEVFFLKYINKILKVNSPFDEEELLTEAIEEIKNIKNDPFEKVAFEYFDFESWIVARLKRKQFAHVHRETYLTSVA